MEMSIELHFTTICLLWASVGLTIFTLSLGQQFAHLTLSSTENICSVTVFHFIHCVVYIEVAFQ